MISSRLHINKNAFLNVLLIALTSCYSFAQSGLSEDSNTPLSFPFFESDYIPLVTSEEKQDLDKELKIFKPSTYIIYNFKFTNDAQIETTVSDEGFFGQIETRDPNVGLVLIDQGEYDKDALSITINGVGLTENFELNHTLQGIIIPLQYGFNRLELKSVSLGSKGLTTGEFGLYSINGNRLLSKKFNLSIASSIILFIDRK